MEYVNINNLFQGEITVIDNSLMPPNFVGDVSTIRRAQDGVRRVLDELGQLSADAQGLGRVITTAERLRTADGHTIYIIKDEQTNSGRGEAVGLLKVGKKRLFMFDHSQKLHEVEPLCILDFFIRKSHQRLGLGRKLFDFMLQHQHVSPEMLAVDGPSNNMRAFLAKHYNIKELIKQNNNFAISPLFFATNTSTRALPQDRRFTESAPAGRFSASQPRSSMADGLQCSPSVRDESRTHPDEVPHYKTLAFFQHKTRRRPQSRQDLLSDLRPAQQPSSRLKKFEKWQRGSSGAPTPAPSPQSAGAQAAAGSGGGGAAEPQRPCSLAVAATMAAPPCTEPATPAGTPSRRDSHLTDKGFFDVKFYHKKLW